MAKNKDIERLKKLDKIKFIDFYEAIKNDDESYIKVSEKEFFDLKKFFDKQLKIKKSNLQYQLSNINRDISILKSCINLILLNEKDEDVINIISSFNIEYNDSLNQYVLNIKNYIIQLNDKIKFLSTAIPKANKETDNNGYAILAKLNQSVGFKINKLSKVTVTEYINYSLSLLKQKEILDGRNRQNNVRRSSSVKRR